MLIIFAALAAVFFTLERLLPWRQQRILRSGFLADIVYIPIHFLMRVVLNGFVATSLAEAARYFLSGTSLEPLGTGLLAKQPVWLQSIVLLLVLDLIFYVIHRLKHRWRWWWRLHETHHSSKDLDFLSSARFHPLEKALDRTIFLLPLMIIGPSDAAILVWASVDADRKSTRLNSSHSRASRMPSSA